MCLAAGLQNVKEMRDKKLESGREGRKEKKGEGN